MKTNITKFCARAAATLAFPLKRLPVALLMMLTTATGWAEDLTDFVTVSSSGTATARFAFSDHFYRVDWSGINTSETSSVLLFYSSTYGYLKAQRNGNTSDLITLYASASSDYWKASNITGLTPGQSSDGYTRNADLATGASYPSVFKKVCTVTCLSASAPTWAWSADRLLHRLPPVGIHPHRPRLPCRGHHLCRAAGAAVPHETVGQPLQDISRNDDTYNKNKIKPQIQQRLNNKREL